MSTTRCRAAQAILFTSLITLISVPPSGRAALAADPPTASPPAATVSSAADGEATATAAEVLDAAIARVKAEALRADRVDWKAAEPELRRMVAGAHVSADAYPAIRLLLSRLGDHHSMVLSPTEESTYKESAATNAPADLRVLSGGVGYIGIPRYAGSDETAARSYSQRVHEGFAAARKAAACGWVVDLRANEGGNMWPMLSGLKPLLGEGVVGYFVDRDGQRIPWTAGAGGILKPPPALHDLKFAWVAVLTGPSTASAGEFVVIAFRGRPNTRSFGRPTFGVSTGNQPSALPDGGRLYLTTALGMDRTGKAYGSRIEPDELVWGAPPAYPGAPDDRALAAAARWLRQASGCGMRGKPVGRGASLGVE